MADAQHSLEHFYFGQIVTGDKPTGEPQLLAASPGITPKLVEQVVARVMLPPLIRSENGAWALVRGRSRQAPFILTQAQQGEYGQVIHHYIIAQPDVLKAIGGNLKVLMTLVEDQLPVFKDTWKKLKRIELAQPPPLTVDEQVEDILELMTVAKNRTQIIEPLLAAIVQGNQLIIQGAPPDLQERVQFVSGMLALLPTSARFGVTFTTHSLPSTEIDSQIRFYSDDAPPPETVVFNWSSGRVFGEELSDEYSRYVMSQLRLDTSLVIERTGAMASVAGWRLNEGDNLAEALGYASKRFKMDEALRNNQPVNKDDVAKILADDPTLSGDLQKLYAEHLIRFSLAMNDMSHADPVAPLLRHNTALAASTLQQMDDAIRDGKAGLIFNTFVHWMAHPVGPEGTQWVDLTHRALLAQARMLVDEQQADELRFLLEQVINAGPALAVNRVVSKLIGTVLPLARQDHELARLLFLLGIQYLDSVQFNRLMSDRELVAQLPPEAQYTWNYIQSGNVGDAPIGFLAQTARTFGAEWEPLVLTRLVEIAIHAGVPAAMDTPTIQALLQIAISPEASQYAKRLLAAVDAVDENLLLRLEPAATVNLLQIRLALADYASLARQMIQHYMLLYPGDKQVNYIDAVHQVFAETPLSEEATVAALRAIQRNGIKELPYAIAIISSLNGLKANEALTEIAGQATDYLLTATHIHELVPPEAIIALIHYYSDARDAQGMLRAASIVPFIALKRGGRGMRLLRDTYKSMDWNDAAQKAALQMLRVFVREMPVESMDRAVEYYGRELGEQVQRALTITVAIRKGMSGLGIMDFSRAVHTAYRFLYDCAALYAEHSQPSQNDLYTALGAMTGVPSIDERRMAVRQIETIATSIVALGQQYQSKRARKEDEYIDQLVQAKVDPRSALDVMRMIAGILARGQREHLDIVSKSPRQALSVRSVDSWINEIDQTGKLLAGMVEGLVETNQQISAADVREELRSIWESLDDESQHMLRRVVAFELQWLIHLIVRIEQTGDAKTFEDSGLAKRIQARKHKPRNALEFLRLMQIVYGGRV